MTSSDVLTVVLVALLLASMPVFALIARQRPPDADVARRSTTILLGVWIRDWLMWVISPAERWLVRREVSPDVFNYLGVVLGAAAGVAFAMREFSAAGWLVLLGGLADVFDGRVARARGLASAYGAFMDSTLDRFAEVFTFVGVAWCFSGNASGVALTALAMGGSLLVSYTRARGEAVGVASPGGLMQRAERLVLLAVTALVDPLVAAQWPVRSGMVVMVGVAVIAAGALGTGVFRVFAIGKILSRRDRSK